MNLQAVITTGSSGALGALVGSVLTFAYNAWARRDSLSIEKRRLRAYLRRSHFALAILADRFNNPSETIHRGTETGLYKSLRGVADSLAGNPLIGAKNFALSSALVKAEFTLRWLLDRFDTEPNDRDLGSLISHADSSCCAALKLLGDGALLQFENLRAAARTEYEPPYW